MYDYLQILGQEIYKILFLLVPILVSVAMIVWLDRRVWGLVQKGEDQMLLVRLVFYKLWQMPLKYIFKEIIIPASANKTVFFSSNSHNDFRLNCLGSDTIK